MNKWYGDGVDINKPVISLFPVLNKIDTMEDVASFIQTHPRTIRKYASQIVDKIRTCKATGAVHLNAIRTLVQTEQDFWNISMYDDSLGFREAVFMVLKAYGDWLLPMYVPSTSPILFDKNGEYTLKWVYDRLVRERFNKSYLPAILLCSNPATVDSFITRYPEAREYLYDFVIDRQFHDTKPGNRNLVREFMMINFPTVSKFAFMDKDFFYMRNFKKELIDAMNVSDAEKIELSRLPIDDVLACFARIYGTPTDHEELAISFDHAENRFKYLEKMDTVSRFERYYGDDAALLFNEVISIFYHWVWEKSRFGDWINRIVIEERKFMEYISNEYEVDPGVSKLFALSALDWVDSFDATPEEIARVKTLIASGEKVTENPNSEPVEPTFYKWKKDLSDFEELAMEEEDDLIYESASEARTRRKGNIKRTAKLERVKSKAYGVAKDVSDSVGKVDSSITSLMDAMKKMFLGDTRSEIIEGQQMTFLTLFKKLIGLTFAWHLGPVKGACALLVRYAMKKRITSRERNQIIHEIDTEIAIITEKINDADRDGNRKAKYNMMRTKAELERARARIRVGLGNNPRKASTVKTSLSEGGYQ